MLVFDIIYENLTLKIFSIKGIGNLLNQIYNQFYSTTIKFLKK